MAMAVNSFGYGGDAKLRARGFGIPAFSGRPVPLANDDLAFPPSPPPPVLVFASLRNLQRRKE